MTIKHLFTSFLLFTILLTSCATLEVGIETTPTTDQAAIETTVAEIVQATVQASETQPTETPSPTIEAMTTNAPTEAPQPESSSPYAGIIYRLGDQLFRVGPDGQTLSLAPGLDSKYMPGQFTPRGTISPDGQWLISWWDFEDLWLINLATGKLANLTNTTDRIEYSAQFVPNQPDTIIFLSQPKQSSEMSAGYLSTMKLDGSGYRVLDETDGCLGQPSVSPDGQTIAYDRAGHPWLYRWENGPEAFLPGDYGLQGIKDSVSIGSAAWSPTGRYLAWIAGGDLGMDGTPLTAVLVFDLENHTYRLIHPYQAIGRSGWFIAPTWSPDGYWLTFPDESAEQPGLWLAHADGSGELTVYTTSIRSVGGLTAIWSPNSQYLLVSDPNAEGGIRLTLLDLLTTQTEGSPLPAGAIPLAWVQ